MKLVLRGHIRKSFHNDDLYKLVKAIETALGSIEIYIHTWSIFDNGVSWRLMSEDTTPVSERVIHDYFREYAGFIRHIIIDDERDVQLVGLTDGTINRGPMPLGGWKKYWYGKWRISSFMFELYKDKMRGVINMRFDILNVHGLLLRCSQIVKFVLAYKNVPLSKNVFLHWGAVAGIDNIYVGTIHTQYLLADHFHNKLDDILASNDKTIIKQEYLVFLENLKLFRTSVLYDEFLKRVLRGLPSDPSCLT